MKKLSLILSAAVLTAMMLSSCEKDAPKEVTFEEVTIGTQVWMTKNLIVDTFRNGDPIPEAYTNEEWKKAGENGQPAWCSYDNDFVNVYISGKLYNWYAVNDPRGLAPDGWHVPTDAEWTKLTDFLGGTDVAGGKMKTTDTLYWRSPNTAATNESGFSGLPGGLRNVIGAFFNIGTSGYWWSSTEFNTSNAWYRYLNYGNGSVNRHFTNKGKGFSVRCLRD